MFCRFKILIVEKRLVHLVKFACHNNFAIIFVKFRNFCRIVASIDKRNMSRIYIILQILWMILCHFFVWFLGSRSFLYLISRRLISRTHTNLKTFQRTVFAQDIVSFQISLEKKSRFCTFKCNLHKSQYCCIYLLFFRFVPIVIRYKS